MIKKKRGGGEEVIEMRGESDWRSISFEIIGCFDSCWTNLFPITTTGIFISMKPAESTIGSC